MGSTDTIANEIAAAIIADKCRSDQDFARRMWADCESALSSSSGVSLEGDVKVSVVRNTPKRVHVVLPDYVCQKDKEQDRLTDEQMAQVAGGEIFVAVIAACTAGLLGAAVGIGIGVEVGRQG